MLKLYFEYFGIQLKSIMEYKKDFIISLISQMISSIFAFISIIILFKKFGNIQGYTFNQILICFSVSYAGFATAEGIFRGFDRFEVFLANGEFDRMLVRPRNIIFQVIASKIEFSKIGRILIGIIVLIWVMLNNPSLISIDKICTILFMFIGTIIVYGCLFVIQAGITFFTIQKIEIMNIFTDGGRDLTQYPLDIYHKVVKNIFTFIIPLAFVNYYPFLYLIGINNNKLYIFAPIVSILFVIPSYCIWRIGLKKYKSIGS